MLTLTKIKSSHVIVFLLFLVFFVCVLGIYSYQEQLFFGSRSLGVTAQSQQAQTSYQNPFVQPDQSPVMSYQNPFLPVVSPSPDSTYQNPFSPPPQAEKGNL